MTERPIHDWMLPRLQRLLAEAATAGFARAPCVAVIADIMMTPEFNTAPPPPEPEIRPITPTLRPLQEDYSSPTLGQTDWIKPTGQP
jgi:hypothetical protein